MKNSDLKGSSLKERSLKEHSPKEWDQNSTETRHSVEKRPSLAERISRVVIPSKVFQKRSPQGNQENGSYSATDSAECKISPQEHETLCEALQRLGPRS